MSKNNNVDVRNYTKVMKSYQQNLKKLNEAQKIAYDMLKTLNFLKISLIKNMHKDTHTMIDQLSTLSKEELNKLPGLQTNMENSLSETLATESSTDESSNEFSNEFSKESSKAPIEIKKESHKAIQLKPIKSSELSQSKVEDLETLNIYLQSLSKVKH